MQNNTVTSEETYNNIIISTDETIVEVTQPVTNVIEIATIGPQGPPGLPGDTIFQDIGNNTYRTTSSIEITGSLNVSGSINGTASYSENSKFAEFSNIEYVDNSNVFSLGQIEVIDFSEDVAVTFVNGRLKFIFGNPAIPTIDTFTFNNTFATNRFNQIIDNYDISGSFSIGGYTLISASIYTGSTLLASTSDPLNTSLFFNLNESGSQAYRFEITSSNPLTSVINSQSISLTGTLNKTLPGIPTISPTATVQLGASNFQIEQGATGSITFTSNTGSANGWEYIPATLITNLSSPIEITGPNTGSSPISISASAQYQSPIGDNIPQIFSTRNSSITTYTKIKSLRYGASISSSFTLPELEDLSTWDSSSLGGNIGTIAKGITTVSGQTLTIYWTEDKYQYIIYNASLPPLTSIVSSGFNVLPTQFDLLPIVDGYRIYRTKVVQSGYSGISITYTLT